MMANLQEKPKGAGKSSFELIDSGKLFKELALKKGNIFLDLGCGKGEYALSASEIVGDNGLTYAFDLWDEGIHALREQASRKGITNIKAILGDIGKELPIEDKSVNVCLLATVLHDLVEINVAEGVLKEVARVLNLQGTLAIVEFKKIAGPPGPPIHIRLTPEDVERIVAPHGFCKEKVVEVGAYNYLITFIITF